MVKESGEILLDLVNNILDYSKIEVGEVKLLYNNFNLHKLLESVIDVLYIQAYNKNLDLAFLIPIDVPVFLKGDKLKIKQIFINIIGNAIKFTENGYVFVKLSANNVVFNFILFSGIQSHNI